MKLIDLFEAKDYENILDPADKWLAQYTYENLNKTPSPHIIQTLIQRYPYEGGVIYRGLNFYTKEQYDAFMAPFGGGAHATRTFNTVSSWAKTASGAEQFAITQPTYFLNKEVMVAHGEMQKRKERLSGYRGIILSLHVPPNSCIDVDKSHLGHESEVILPAGTYDVHVHELIKQYAHHLQDQDTTIDQVIQDVKSSKQAFKSGDSHTFFEYVLHHHKDDLSDASRTHIFQLFKPKPHVPVFMHDVTPAYSLHGELPNQVEFDYAIPASKLFSMYQAGVFKDPKHVMYVKKLATQVMNTALPLLQEYLVKARRINLEPIRQIAQIANVGAKLNEVLRNTLGAEYERLQKEGEKINQISDAKARAKAMEDHTARLDQLFKKM